MAGCYGSSPEDRYYESMLFEYLKDCDSAEAEAEARETYFEEKAERARQRRLDEEDEMGKEED